MARIIISTINYNGATAQITFLPNTGGTVSLGTHVLPYEFDLPYYNGTFSLYFPATGTTCTDIIKSCDLTYEISQPIKIRSNNYSGKTANLTFYPASGGSVPIGNVTLPYTGYGIQNYGGTYDFMFYPNNNICSITLPTPTPTPTPTNTPTPTPTPTQTAEFISVWRTTTPNQTIQLPLIEPEDGGGYNFYINWGDGSGLQNIVRSTDKSHTYTTPGDYTVTITGTIQGFNFSLAGTKNIIEIKKWGCLRLGNNGGYFIGCGNLTLTGVTDSLVLGDTSNLKNMFASCTSITTIPYINNWDVSNVTNMDGMFSETYFNSSISGWNVSNVFSMNDMFGSNTSFNQPLSNWQRSTVGNTSTLSSVTGMTAMFSKTSSFNQNIGNWNVSNVKDMSDMFYQADSFNNGGSPSISGWNVTSVKDMDGMFRTAISFNQNIGNWDVSAVGSMNSMFEGAKSFNNGGSPSISGWSVSYVDGMNDMFYGATGFTQNLSNWCPLNITTKPTNFLTNTPIENQYTYYPNWGCVQEFISVWRTTVPNQTIRLPLYSVPATSQYSFTVDWGDGSSGYITNAESGGHVYTSQGTYTVKIKGIIKGFNFNITNDSKNNLIEIKKWGCLKLDNVGAYFNECINLKLTGVTDTPNLTNVTNLNSMFASCTGLTIVNNIGNWNVSGVTGMNSMFSGARSFNSPLNSWNVSNVTGMTRMFENTGVFNQDISNWCVQNIPSEPFNFSTGSALIQQNKPLWGQCPNVFTSIWRTTSPNESITLPLDQNGEFNFVVDWGDGKRDYITTYNQSERTHTYSTQGNYTVTIRGTIKGFNFGLVNQSNTKIREIKKWGQLRLDNGYNSGNYFNNCTNLILTGVTDTLNLSGTNSLYNMFYECTSLTTINNIGNWNMSSITSMNQMFYACVNFNQNLSTWNVGNVTDMSGMFNGCQNFDGSLATWNVSGVTNMFGMFFACQELRNGDVGDWNVSNVTDMSSMFHSCTNFNADISTWSVNKVINMSYMFFNCLSYDGLGISIWNVGNVQNMNNMFFNCTLLNEDIGYWNVSGVTDMNSMFYACVNFDQDLRLWNVGNVQDMSYMFYGCTNFNNGDDISGYGLSLWNVSNVFNMDSMFYGCQYFNRSLYYWTPYNVINMDYMFYNATSFSQSINMWCIPNILSVPQGFADNTGVFQQWGNYPNFGCLNEFTSKWSVNGGESITLPLVDYGTYGFFVDWGDGSSNYITTYDQIEATHIYANKNVYTVTIKWLIQGFNFYTANTSKQKIVEITQWGCLKLIDPPIRGEGQFAGCGKLVLTGVTDTPNLSLVTKLESTFEECDELTTINQLTYWNVSGITGMDNMFRFCGKFDQDLSSWCIPQISDIPSGMFNGTSMYQEYSKYPNFGVCLSSFISKWETQSPNETISLPLISSGVYKFFVDWGDGSNGGYITTYNQSETTHTYSSVGLYTITIRGTIEGFNFDTVPESRGNIKEITQWGCLRLGNERNYFKNCGNLTLTGVTDNLVLGNTTDLTSMFENCESLFRVNNIVYWDFSNVLYMDYMFRGATTFNQDISQMCVPNITTIPTDFLKNTVIDSAWRNYPNFGCVTPFISKWINVYAEDTITLPLVSNGQYDFIVSWGDGYYDRITSYTQGTHTYSERDTVYTVSIRGIIKGFSFNSNNVSREKIKEITQWGCLELGNGSRYFSTCHNLTLTGVTDTPILTGTTTFMGMFQNCTGLTYINNIQNWNVSNVTDMNGMFYNCTNFNSPLNSWNVSNVTAMGEMFRNASSFNQPLSGWNVSNVENMEAMFRSATSFNQDISDWVITGFTSAGALSNFMDGKDGPNFNSTYYNNMLLKWSSLPNLYNAVEWGMGNIKYNRDYGVYREFLINNKGWGITDGGQVE